MMSADRTGLITLSLTDRLSSDFPTDAKEILKRIGRLNQDRGWFQPRTEEDIEALIPSLREAADAIFTPDCFGALYPEAGGSWLEALNLAKRMITSPYNVIRREAHDLAWEEARSSTEPICEEILGPGHPEIWETAAHFAGQAAAWAAKSPDSKITNPFSRIFALYEMGAAGVHFLPIRYQIAGKGSLTSGLIEMLRVHLPVIKTNPHTWQNETYLSCLVFGPDKKDRPSRLIHSVANHMECLQMRTAS